MRILALLRTVDEKYNPEANHYFTHLLNTLGMQIDDNLIQSLSKLSVNLKAALNLTMNSSDHMHLEMLSDVIDLLHQLLSEYTEVGIVHPYQQLCAVQYDITSLEDAKNSLAAIKARMTPEILQIYADLNVSVNNPVMIPFTTVYNNHICTGQGALKDRANRKALKSYGICYLTSAAELKALFPECTDTQTIYPVVVRKGSKYETAGTNSLACGLLDIQLPVKVK